MIPAAAVKDELQIWRMVWLEVDAFIDRVLSARGDDGKYKDQMRALLALATALEADARCRTGAGFLPPLELAEAAGESVRHELTESTELSEPDQPVIDPAMRRRLPGAYDVELAVGAISILPGLEKFEKVQLMTRLHLFDLFDADTKSWQPFDVPSYDVGSWGAGDAAKQIDPNAGFFPLPLRVELAIAGHGDLLSFSALRNSRLVSRRSEEHRIDAVALAGLAAGSIGASDRQQLRSAAKRAARACRSGLSAIAAARAALESTAFGAHLPLVESELGARAADYEALDRQLGGSIDPASFTPLANRMGGRGAVGGATVTAALDAALDEAIDARIAYPDGTLRILRTLEWGFRMHWPARDRWFEVRQRRRLEPLLGGFLEPFVHALADAIAGRPRALPWSPRLGRAAPTGAQSLLLEPLPNTPAAPLVAGSIALIEGQRRALAVCLRVEASPADEAWRLHILPLIVSLAGGPSAPGTAGLISSGARLTNVPPAELTSDALLRGEVAGHPEHDGVPAALIALWSRLCLLLGTTEVTSRLAAAGAAASLSALSVGARLPVLGPVAPAASRLILDVNAMRGAFDVDHPSGLPFARAGELLLLVGRDAAGDRHQSAVKLLSIARKNADEVDDETAAAPLARPVCCQGKGDRLVLQIETSGLDRALARDIRLHRDFRGFGSPSLAAERLLPDAVDASPRTAGENRDIDRSAELALAVRTLKDWLA
ncbi:MAG TPA: hypothetical protein VMG12_20400 [Polyangiaceae bacterium]|nr:hypothetical protein [Polyangiaceae bacterium]